MKSNKVFLVLLAVITVISVTSCANPWWPEKDKGTLSYDANGGVGTVPAAQTADFRTKITVASQNGLTKIGHNFDGWNTKNTGDGVDYATGSTLTLTGDTTLFAKWVKNDDDNTDTENPESYNPFNGYPGNNGYYYPGGNVGPGIFRSKREKKLSVAYDGNGNTGGKVPVDPRGPDYALGDEVEVQKIDAASPLLKSGYVFAEWSTHPTYNDLGISLTSGETFVIDEDIIDNNHHPSARVRATNDNTIYLHAVWVGEWKVIKLDMGTVKYTFPEKEYGYGALNKADMMILNPSVLDDGTPGVPTDELTVRVSGDKDNFTYTLPDSITSIDPGKNVPFSIVPKAGLMPGNYSVKIEIFNGPDYQSSNIRACFIVGFTVVPHPLELKVTRLINYRDKGEYELINSLTPIEAGAYTERTANFQVTVSGFKKSEDADGVALKFIDAYTESALTGLSFSTTGSSYLNGALVFEVEVTYDGTTDFAPTKQKTTGVPSDYCPFVVGIETTGVTPNSLQYYYLYAYDSQVVNVTDGKAQARAVQVNRDNITHFNEYARTNGLDRHYKQTEDITLASGSPNWTAIGTGAGAAAFSGSYDGGEKTITGLTVNGENYQGMFGYNTGTVKNLGLVGGSITGSGQYIGGVAGDNSGTIDNCYSKGDVSSTAVKNDGTFESFVGGIVGRNNGSSSKVLNSHATGTVTAAGGFVGGVAGRNNGRVENSYATGNVTAGNTGYGSYAGGVVGNNFGGTVLSSYYTTGTVYGSHQYVGGVAGTTSNGGKIENSHATGNVTGWGNAVGGVQGASGTGSATLLNCYATGDVTGGDNVGGVVGDNNNTSTVDNCYATGNVSGGDNVGGVAGLNQSTSTVKNSYATGNVSGSASVGGVVGLNRENCKVQSSYYTTGTVEGYGNNVGGVVGNNSGTVEYCYVKGVAISGEQSSGGVVGNNAANSLVQNCYAADITGTFVSRSAGVVGYNSGTVKNCYSTGSITAEYYFGGAVGRNNAGTVEYCYSTCIVSSDSYSSNADDFAGGVLGQNWNTGATLRNTVALNPSITAPNLDNVGRVLGRNSTFNALQPGSTPSNNYARSDMIISRGSPQLPTSYPRDDGTDISSAQWNNASWWTTAGNWASAAWDTNAWNIVNGSLPTLKGMPGSPSQNPVVP